MDNETLRNRWLRNILLGKGAVEQPGNDGQISALIVRRQDNRVLVLSRDGLCRSHCCGTILSRVSEVKKSRIRKARIENRALFEAKECTEVGDFSR